MINGFNNIFIIFSLMCNSNRTYYTFLILIINLFFKINVIILY